MSRATRDVPHATRLRGRKSQSLCRAKGLGLSIGEVRRREQETTLSESLRRPKRRDTRRDSNKRTLKRRLRQFYPKWKSCSKAFHQSRATLVISLRQLRHNSQHVAMWRKPNMGLAPISLPDTRYTGMFSQQFGTTPQRQIRVAQHRRADSGWNLSGRDS